MTKPLPRASFSSSRLIRLLAELADCDSADSKQAKPSFAERLGQWLDFTDAIALSAALNSPPTRGRRSPAAGDEAAPALLFARVSDALAAAIRADGAGKQRIRLPAVPAEMPADIVIEFAPYRRYCIAHQRDMEAEISQLRGELRAALTRHSPGLAQLAALDAVFEQGLGERERTLLAKVPALLEVRFSQLQIAVPMDQSAPPCKWLAVFCKDMQAVLLAELELRLQPVSGLLETLNKACRDEAAASIS